MSQFSSEVFRDLYSYMEWADATAWRVALANEAARQDDKIRELFHHLHLVQRAFLAMWTENPLAPIVETKASQFPQLADIRAWAHPYYEGVRRFLQIVDATVLDRPLVIPWFKEYEQQLGRSLAEPTIGETMFQVVNHTTHHRAQINSRLRALGADPSPVDHIVWVVFGRPAPEWGT